MRSYLDLLVFLQMPILNYLAVPGNSLTGVVPASIFSMQYLIGFLAVRLGPQQGIVGGLGLRDGAQLLCPATQGPVTATTLVARLPRCIKEVSAARVACTHAAIQRGHCSTAAPATVPDNMLMPLRPPGHHSSC